MQATIQKHIAEVCQKLFDHTVEVVLDIPEEQFGDYATNVALQLAKPLAQKPREIAQKIRDSVDHPAITRVDVAGPGFLNIRLSDEALLQTIEQSVEQSLRRKKIVAEYSDLNPFKILHAGHLYTSIVGDAIANLLERAGGDVHRVNFGGDVGMHVARTMYAMLKQDDFDEQSAWGSIQAIEHESLEYKASYIATRYVSGTAMYEDDDTSRAEIIALNKRIYKIHEEDDRDSALAQMYWTCRQWSYDYFDEFYASIGSGFERYYPESQTAEIGQKIVQEHIGDVFHESDGAVVFDGEKFGLHTRVFINSEGLPTYETKDVGLIFKKHEDYTFDRSVVITGNEQLQYMEVVLKAVEQFAPELAAATTHLTHGMVKLKGGIKMSSRKGNILRATEVIAVASDANKKVAGNEDPHVTLAAVKYAMLKNRMGGDIAYDPEESVSVQGNSGPYLQYAHARARSVLAKTTVPDSLSEGEELTADERRLARKLSHYAWTQQRAIEELAPHVICTYLYELAQSFNRFYEDNRVVGDDRENVRSYLVSKYADTLKDGLNLLGITAVEKM